MPTPWSRKNGRKSAPPGRNIANGHPVVNFLAISGGGSDGAGAGLITGWTASGKRPEFDVVTGVSTGALAAPFVSSGRATIRL